MSKKFNVKAIALMQEGKYEEAYEMFSASYEEDNSNLEALYFRAIIDFGHLKTHFEVSQEDFIKLSNKKNPYQVPAIQLLTIMYDMNDDYDNVLSFEEYAKTIQKIVDEWLEVINNV